VFEEGDIRLAESGQRFVDAGINSRKQLFTDSLRANVPLVAAIRGTLDCRPNYRPSNGSVRDE
jgi:hypothetical protein